MDAIETAKRKCWFADKPGSVRRRNSRRDGDGHLSMDAIACDLEQSTRESSEPGRLARLRYRSNESLALCLILLRAGFTKPTESPRSLVSFYLTVSPLPRISELTVRRFAFCGTVPNLAAGRRYRPLCPAKPGLSSPGRNQQRPSGEPTAAF